jgi:ATP-dependent helicase HrpB
MHKPAAPLPIDEALPSLKAALAAGNAAVLVAPPGAGKTTRVPLALLDEPWLNGGGIVMLEPRRLAARGAADFMAKSRGERLGECVGLRVRLHSRVSARTRVTVVTEGVFTRMILADPALEGVAAVIFDEFHERSLDADLGLALALDAQAALRPDLRILVMSATLDGVRVADLLGGAPVVESAGRSFPVTTRHLGRRPDQRVEEAVAEAVATAIRTESGSILAFLPGQAEIVRCRALLAERLDPGVILAPLYGALDAADQDRAVLPAPPGRRKVVLATSIAETSLTIEGVRIVVDCGLARVPRYEPDSGLTRLVTERVSRAAADQRRGRAGRVEPGICYRLWEEAATGSLPAYADPEIRSADLAPLLLDCAAWGVSDPARLSFMDSPPAPALAEARALLVELQALDRDGRLTDTGRRMQALPLPPRLAHMLIVAADRGAAGAAARLAAVIVERSLGGDSADLAVRLDRFSADRSRRAEDARRLADGWARSAGRGAPATTDAAGQSPAALLALAYPDRIARARDGHGAFLLANGRGAHVDAADALAREKFLVVAEMTGSAARARILSAVALAEAELPAIAGARIVETEELGFDRASAALRARTVRRLGAIVLADAPRPAPDSPQARVRLARGLVEIGLARLPWSKAQQQLISRVTYLNRVHGGEPHNPWPDLSPDALAESAEDWLAPLLVGKTSLAALSPDDLQPALEIWLPWALRRRLEAELPSHFEAPTGSRIAIDYNSSEGPSIAVRVQELFGLTTHPAIAGGRVPLILHLLSPARRPIQITRDLPGFWRGSWAAVRSEMKGRYPRHPWPEDPAVAAATTRAKPRGT